MVKYLVVPALESLNASLQRINFGDHSICGRLNCYSLKMVQSDKKLVKHLQREYSNEKMAQQLMNKNRNVDPQQLGNSIQKLVQVPVGNLHEFSTVRLISYFISTLNASYTDFDFTSCEPNQFQEEKPQTVNETINARLTPLTKSKPLLMDSFWKNINSVMDLQQCQFYTFTLNDDVKQVLRPHSLWNIDYFIVNLKQKKLLYVSLYCQNNLYQKLSLDEKMDFDEMMDINDGMAWCETEEMSPHSSHNNNSNRNHNNNNNHSHNNHNYNHNHANKSNNNNQGNNSNRNININKNLDTSMKNNNFNDNMNNHNYGNNMNNNGNNNNNNNNNNNDHVIRSNNKNNNNCNQLHVMSVDNCLGTMPQLERPSDL